MATPGASEANAAILASSLADAEKQQLYLYVICNPSSAAAIATTPSSSRDAVFLALLQRENAAMTPVAAVGGNSAAELETLKRKLVLMEEQLKKRVKSSTGAAVGAEQESEDLNSSSDSLKSAASHSSHSDDSSASVFIESDQSWGNGIVVEYDNKLCVWTASHVLLDVASDAKGGTLCTNIKLKVAIDPQELTKGFLELKWTRILHTGHLVGFPITGILNNLQYDVAIIELSDETAAILRKEFRYRIPFQGEAKGHHKHDTVQGQVFFKSQAQAINSNAGAVIAGFIPPDLALAASSASSHVSMEWIHSVITSRWVGVGLCELKDPVKIGYSGGGLMDKHPIPLSGDKKAPLLVAIVCSSGLVDGVNRSMVVLTSCFITHLLERPAEGLKVVDNPAPSPPSLQVVE